MVSGRACVISKKETYLVTEGTKRRLWYFTEINDDTDDHPESWLSLEVVQISSLGRGEDGNLYVKYKYPLMNPPVDYWYRIKLKRQTSGMSILPNDDLESLPDTPVEPETWDVLPDVSDWPPRKLPWVKETPEDSNVNNPSLENEGNSNQGGSTQKALEKNISETSQGALIGNVTPTRDDSTQKTLEQMEFPHREDKLVAQSNPSIQGIPSDTEESQITEDVFEGISDIEDSVEDAEDSVQNEEPSPIHLDGDEPPDL